MKKGLIVEIKRMRELMGRLCEGVNDHDVLDRVWISYGTSAFDPDKFKTYDSSFSKEAYKKRIIDRGLEKCIPYSEFMVQRRRDMGNTNKPRFGLLPVRLTVNVDGGISVWGVVGILIT